MLLGLSGGFVDTALSAAHTVETSGAVIAAVILGAIGLAVRLRAPNGIVANLLAAGFWIATVEIAVAWLVAEFWFYRLALPIGCAALVVAGWSIVHVSLRRKRVEAGLKDPFASFELGPLWQLPPRDANDERSLIVELVRFTNRQPHRRVNLDVELMAQLTAGNHAIGEPLRFLRRYDPVRRGQLDPPVDIGPELCEKGCFAFRVGCSPFLTFDDRFGIAVDGATMLVRLTDHVSGLTRDVPLRVTPISHGARDADPLDDPETIARLVELRREGRRRRGYLTQSAQRDASFKTGIAQALRQNPTFGVSAAGWAKRLARALEEAGSGTSVLMRVQRLSGAEKLFADDARLADLFDDNLGLIDEILASLRTEASAAA